MAISANFAVFAHKEVTRQGFAFASQNATFAGTNNSAREFRNSAVSLLGIFSLA